MEYNSKRLARKLGEIQCYFVVFACRAEGHRQRSQSGCGEVASEILHYIRLVNICRCGGVLVPVGERQFIFLAAFEGENRRDKPAFCLCGGKSCCTVFASRPNVFVLGGETLGIVNYEVAKACSRLEIVFKRQCGGLDLGCTVKTRNGNFCRTRLAEIYILNLKRASSCRCGSIFKCNVNIVALVFSQVESVVHEIPTSSPSRNFELSPSSLAGVAALIILAYVNRTSSRRAFVVKIVGGVVEVELYLVVSRKVNARRNEPSL